MSSQLTITTLSSGMYSIRLLDPEPNESPEDICWHNMNIADVSHDIKIFIFTIKSWFKLNPGKNYQDLEIELRKRNFNTDLIASKRNITIDSKIKLPNKQVIIYDGYECIIACLAREKAEQELLTYWPSYDNNFLKLPFAGELVTDSDNIFYYLVLHHNISITARDMEVSELIINNSKKIVVCQSARKYWQNMVQKCL